MTTVTLLLEGDQPVPGIPARVFPTLLLCLLLRLGRHRRPAAASAPPPALQPETRRPRLPAPNAKPQLCDIEEGEGEEEVQLFMQPSSVFVVCARVCVSLNKMLSKPFSRALPRLHVCFSSYQIKLYISGDCKRVKSNVGHTPTLFHVLLI